MKSLRLLSPRKQFLPERKNQRAFTSLVSETLTLQALALHLAGAAYGLGGLAGTALGRLFEVTAELHFAENALALKLFLERFQRLIDIIITNENLHLAEHSSAG
jgi:hypothetical protein